MNHGMQFAPLRESFQEPDSDERGLRNKHAEILNQRGNGATQEVLCRRRRSGGQVKPGGFMQEMQSIASYLMNTPVRPRMSFSRT